MPLGGVSILWNEATPAETDIADAAPIRSIETAIRNAMASEHNWPSTGGANTGYHLLGSARPFYGVESNVSSAGTDGRLMVTSDTSRFFHVGSDGTMFLGSQRAISAGSSPVGGQNYYWAEEFGSLNKGAGTDTVTFPNSGYSGAPFVYLTGTNINIGGLSILPILNAVTATTFGVIDGFSSSGYRLYWRSIGTRVL